MAEREERAVTVPANGWKKDALALALLVALMLPVRIWVLVNTEVAARDSIGYIRYALDFEREPWDQVLREHDQHPGYAVAVLAVSQPLRWMSGTTDAVTMQLAAQLTSALAAILLLYPMYHLGRLLFDRRVGFGAALLFQYLPVNGHHLSDGISEALFLLLVASALLQAVRAVHARSPLRFALCGVFSGLAYLTRLEGAMVAMAAAVVLAGMPFSSAWRMSRPRFVACGAALLLASSAVGSIYVYATGHWTRKPTVLNILDSAGPSARAEEVAPQLGARATFLFAVTFPKADRSTVRFARSTRALAVEVCNGFHYAGMIPLLLGMAFALGRLRRLPGFWVLVLYCFIHTASLLALAFANSYVSDRHVMVLVMCGSYLAVAGLMCLPRRLLTFFAGSAAPGSLWLSATLWSMILLAGLIGFCLPKTLQPLHATRAGNRAAGQWLATRLQPGDIVEDDHCWSHYYAGQVFEEGKDPVLPAGIQPICYVVRTRSRDPEINQSRQQDEEKLRQANPPVYHWPENASLDQARVVVYARPRDPTTHPWRVARP